MTEKNSPVVMGIMVATLGALWLVLRAVTLWAAPPSSGRRRRFPMFGSPEADIGVAPGDDDTHHGSADHPGEGGGHGGDGAH